MQKVSNNHIILSIIIPAYNKEACIENTINSILENSYFNDYEIIIINDGSRDSTKDKILSIKNDKIKYIYQDNSGVSAARNRGINEAKGKWLLFLDADDILNKGILDDLTPYLYRPKDVDIIIGNFYITQPSGRKIIWCNSPLLGIKRSSKIWKEFYFKRFFLRCGNFVVKREIVTKNLFDRNISRFEDVKAFIYLLRSSNEILFINNVFMNYCQSFSEASIPNDEKFFNDYCSNIDTSIPSFWIKLIQAELISCAIKDYPKRKDFLVRKYSSLKIYKIINTCLFPIKLVYRKFYAIWKPV